MELGLPNIDRVKSKIPRGAAKHKGVAKHRPGPKKFSHDAFEAQMAFWPAGPRSIRDMLNPSDDIRSSLERRPEMVTRLQANVQFGVESIDTAASLATERPKTR